MRVSKEEGFMGRLAARGGFGEPASARHGCFESRNDSEFGASPGLMTHAREWRAPAPARASSGGCRAALWALHQGLHRLDQLGPVNGFGHVPAETGLTGECAV